jgi:hypothetical protein
MVNRSIVASFPPTLELFDCDSTILFDSDSIAILPRSVTDLSLSGKLLGKNFGVVLQSLNLISLAILRTPLGGTDVRQLPSTLNRLNVGLSRSHIQYLPVHLEWLVCTISEDPQITPWALQFPSRLTYLECPGLVSLDNDDIQRLPSQLTTLKLFSSSNVTDKGCQDLPKTLTHLSIHMTPLLTSDCVANFPRNLKSLTFGPTASPTASCVPLLPPTLTELGLRCCNDLEDMHIKLLPRTLTSFSCETPNLTSFALADFPPQLSYFEHLLPIFDFATGQQKNFHDIKPSNRPKPRARQVPAISHS